MNKKYKLLRDLPGIKAGRILGFERGSVIDERGNNINLYFNPENYPDWFEEVEEKWKPKEGEKYWCVRGTGIVKTYEWGNDSDDAGFVNFGNCFQTKQQAEQVRDKIKKLLKKEREE